MAQQQLGFDFFDAEPEPKASAKQPVPKKNTNEQKAPAVSNAPAKAEPVPDVVKPVEEQKAEPVVEIPSIVVDETIREIAFIAAEPEKKVVTAEKIVEKKSPKPTDRKSTRGRMKLADMDVMVDLVEVPEDEVLFQKRYYGIGEVSNMFKVNISLIRFWENEFDILKPKKNGKGDRLFRPEDVKSLQLIYHLLREKKYSIAGAKDFLKKNKKTEEAFAMIETLKKTKAFLLDLKANL